MRAKRAGEVERALESAQREWSQERALLEQKTGYLETARSEAVAQEKATAEEWRAAKRDMERAAGEM